MTAPLRDASALREVGPDVWVSHDGAFNVIADTDASVVWVGDHRAGDPRGWSVTLPIADGVLAAAERAIFVERAARFIADETDKLRGTEIRTSRGWDRIPMAVTLSELHDYLDANVGWSDELDALGEGDTDSDRSGIELWADTMNRAGELIALRSAAILRGAR